MNSIGIVTGFALALFAAQGLGRREGSEPSHRGPRDRL
jgi:hypothetical protein